METQMSYHISAIQVVAVNIITWKSLNLLIVSDKLLSD